MRLDSPLIHPIRIPTPFAVGDVFSYLIVDEKIVLVDCGQYTEEAFSVLSNALKEQELTVFDIDEIWLTHGHPDHFGQAERLVDCAGAEVYGHPKERANFAGNSDGNLFEEFFERHNIPNKYVRQMVNQLDWLQQFQLPIEPQWIEQGAVLTSGELSVTVHETPGHAPGHLTFVSNQDVIFGGDLLLEHISTNALINFDPDSSNRNASLLQYRNSLQWISEQEGVVLPGHGERIGAIAKVATHHLKEHEKRYQKIQQLLNTEPMNLFEIAYKIFPDAIEQGAIFLVLSEVLGYLDWGIEEHRISLDEHNMIYNLPSNEL